MKMNFVLRLSNKIRNAFRFKDQIPLYMNSNAIYKHKYNICNDICIGEIKCHLFVRQYEHLGRSILTEKPIKYNEKDAAAVGKQDHQQNHTADSFCFSLIRNGTNYYPLKLL